MEDQLLDTWNIHSRIGMYLLDSVPVEALKAAPGTKGRSAGEMFAHINNVRLMWLQAAAPELAQEVSKVDKEAAQQKEVLNASLQASARAIGLLLAKGIEAGGKIKGFKPHATAFLGYLISHESYHIGEIGVALGQAGHPIDKKVAYGIWEWGVR
jgi:uncharacterized damage-inducible protein DinB